MNRRRYWIRVQPSNGERAREVFYHSDGMDQALYYARLYWPGADIVGIAECPEGFTVQLERTNGTRYAGHRY